MKIGVAVVDVGVLKHAESNITGTTSYIENVLRLAHRVGCAGVEGRNEMVPIEY